jgi:hypothetical protein
MASKISELDNGDDGIEYSEQDSSERRAFLNHHQPRLAEKPRVPIFNKVMALVNLALGIILATSLGLVAHSTTEACPESVAQAVDPWC